MVKRLLLGLVALGLFEGGHKIVDARRVVEEAQCAGELDPLEYDQLLGHLDRLLTLDKMGLLSAPIFFRCRLPRANLAARCRIAEIQPEPRYHHSGTLLHSRSGDPRGSGGPKNERHDEAGEVGWAAAGPGAVDGSVPAQSDSHLVAVR